MADRVGEINKLTGPGGAIVEDDQKALRMDVGKGGKWLVDLLAKADGVWVDVGEGGRR